MSRPMNRDKADVLANILGQAADDLLAAGFHPGDLSFAMTTVLAMIFKVHGKGNDVATVKALVCESIDEIWRADDLAQRMKMSKTANRNGN